MNSAGIPEGFAKASWLTPKHHLFNMNIPKKLINAIGEHVANDKRDEYKQGILRQRVLKYLLRKPPTGCCKWFFRVIGDEVAFLRAKYTFVVIL